MNTLDQYERYRDVGEELHGEILGAYADQDAILDSAELLGIEHDGTRIRYDFESDAMIHYEFLIYEYREDGRTFAERYVDEERYDSEAERTVLEATLDAETSLFRISSIEAADDRLVATDLLGDGSDIPVLDIHLSQTAEPGVLLFFRLVSYDGFNATSGVSLPFDGSEADRLLEEYEDRAEGLDSQPPSVRRFAAFYDLYRDHGIRIQYR